LVNCRHARHQSLQKTVPRKDRVHRFNGHIPPLPRHLVNAFQVTAVPSLGQAALNSTSSRQGRHLRSLCRFLSSFPRKGIEGPHPATGRVSPLCTSSRIHHTRPPLLSPRAVFSPLSCQRFYIERPNKKPSSARRQDPCPGRTFPSPSPPFYRSQVLPGPVPLPLFQVDLRRLGSVRPTGHFFAEVTTMAPTFPNPILL